MPIDALRLLAEIGMGDAVAHLQQSRKQSQQWLHEARREDLVSRGLTPSPRKIPEPQPELESRAYSPTVLCAPAAEEERERERAAAMAARAQALERCDEAVSASMSGRSAVAYAAPSSDTSSTALTFDGLLTSPPRAETASPPSGDWQHKQEALERRIADLELKLRLSALDRQRASSGPASVGSSVRSEPQTLPSEPASLERRLSEVRPYVPEAAALASPQSFNTSAARSQTPPQEAPRLRPPPPLPAAVPSPRRSPHGLTSPHWPQPAASSVPVSPTAMREEEEAIQRALAGVAAFVPEVRKDPVVSTYVSRVRSSSPAQSAARAAAGEFTAEVGGMGPESLNDEVARALRSVSFYLDDSSAAAQSALSTVESTVGAWEPPAAKAPPMMLQPEPEPQPVAGHQLRVLHEEEQRPERMRMRQEELDQQQIAQIQQELQERQMRSGQSPYRQQHPPQPPLASPPPQRSTATAMPSGPPQTSDPTPSLQASRSNALLEEARFAQVELQKSLSKNAEDTVKHRRRATTTGGLQQQVLWDSNVDSGGSAGSGWRAPQTARTGSSSSPSPMGTLRTMSEVESDLEVSRGTFRTNQWQIEEAERHTTGLDDDSQAGEDEVSGSSTGLARGASERSASSSIGQLGYASSFSGATMHRTESVPLSDTDPCFSPRYEDDFPTPVLSEQPASSGSSMGSCHSTGPGAAALVRGRSMLPAAARPRSGGTYDPLFQPDNAAVATDFAAEAVAAQSMGGAMASVATTASVGTSPFKTSVGTSPLKPGSPDGGSPGGGGLWRNATAPPIPAPVDGPSSGGGGPGSWGLGVVLEEAGPSEPFLSSPGEDQFELDEQWKNREARSAQLTQTAAAGGRSRAVSEPPDATHTIYQVYSEQAIQQPSPAPMLRSAAEVSQNVEQAVARLSSNDWSEEARRTTHKHSGYEWTPGGTAQRISTTNGPDRPNTKGRLRAASEPPRPAPQQSMSPEEQEGPLSLEATLSRGGSGQAGLPPPTPSGEENSPVEAETSPRTAIPAPRGPRRAGARGRPTIASSADLSPQAALALARARATAKTGDKLSPVSKTRKEIDAEIQQMRATAAKAKEKRRSRCNATELFP